MLILACALCSGCAYRPLPHRPSVEELVQNAMTKSHEGHMSAEAMADSAISHDYALLPAVEELPLAQVEEIHAEPIDAVALHRIEEDFVETDIREALLVMTDEAEADLVMDESITGVVNTQIKDLTLDQAIEKVLMPLGFVYIRKGNQYIIAPPDPASPLFSKIAVQSEYFPVHMEPEKLLATLPDTLAIFAQHVEGSNLILIDAPEQIGAEIRRRLQRIDQPVPQVVLEAIICVVSPDSGFQFGLDWGHAVQLDGTDALNFGATSLAMSAAVSPAGLSNIFSDFATTSAFVKLLCEHGYLTIRASPHVMAKDGEKANISINRETFFNVQPNSTANGDGGFYFQTQIQKVDAGITLDITPQIRGDIVTINIDRAEVSEDIRNGSTDYSLNPFPIINRRSVSTTVHVKDGKTIVIGGLVQRETVDRVNRVPGLSKLPLMGYLFETKQQQMREAEVVIFISPRIVRPSVSLE